jgi:DNA-binding NarL/FixJ family response regulator
VSLAVLYVDDDPVRCEAVRTTLCQSADLKIHTAACWEEAIAVLATLRADMILMDSMLRGLEASATLSSMRGPLTEPIPVIVLADNTVSAEIERLLHLGASGVICKPIDPLTVGNELMNLWLGYEAAPIDDLAAQFLRRTQEDLNRLNELVDRAVYGDWTILEESSRICHAICGAAAMFGYPHLSRAAAGMQQSVQDVLRNLTTPPSTNGLAALSLVDGADAFARALKGSDQAVPDARSMFQPRRRDH